VSALRWADVADATEGDGMLVTVRRSKMNQEGDVRFVKDGAARAIHTAVRRHESGAGRPGSCRRPPATRPRSSPRRSTTAFEPRRASGRRSEVPCGARIPEVLRVDRVREIVSWGILAGRGGGVAASATGRATGGLKAR